MHFIGLSLVEVFMTLRRNWSRKSQKPGVILSKVQFLYSTFRLFRLFSSLASRPSLYSRDIVGIWDKRSRIGRVRNSYNFLSDILR
jgi:hypothetical protein